MSNLTLFAAEVCNTARICTQTLPKTTADNDYIQIIIQVIIAIVAALSVLFVVVGGLRYVFSQGDSNAVSKAKGTIVYALIGLLIAILAQFLVIFVVNRVTPS